MIIAVGLFNYQQNNDTQKYCRHLVTQIANIEYNKATITVKTSGENLEVEDEFILIELDNNSIQEAEKFFEQAVVDEQNDDIALLDIKVQTRLLKILQMVSIWSNIMIKYLSPK
ncbi:hypothetical protein [Abyssogena phaseoliformis symbiont]|uniref:hypothetical protein n=1 Tax=Abyssogena phaseoliformis symbiont TaxID=596095 RepID=UPI0019151CBB|nr:hypothetical protein [Abyssogena phaseoliformis symbiont]